MFKLFNLDTTNDGAANPNECQLDPAAGETEVSPNSSQIFKIVIPVAAYHKAQWLAVGYSNPAQIDKALGQVDMPAIVEGVLNIDYGAENTVDRTVIDDIVWSIPKVFGSITGGTAPVAAASYQQLSISLTDKEIRRYNDSGVLKDPNFLQIYLQADFYGDADIKLAYNTLYRQIMKSSINSEKFNFVDVLTSEDDTQNEINN